MTEQSTEQNNNPEQSEQSTSPDMTQADKVRESMKGQILEERNARIALEQKLASREQADKDAEKKELEAKEQYKTLLEQTQAEYTAKEADYQTKQAQLENKYDSLLQDTAIVKAGVTDELTILGLKAKYASTEDAPIFADWLTDQNIVKDTGRPSGNAGNVSTKGIEPAQIPTTYAETSNMTREQKAQARQVIRDNARNSFG